MVVKILMVNKFLYPNGGSETYIFKLGEELQRQGHEVQYFGMEHEGRIVGNHAEVYTSNMDFHTGKLQKLLYPFRIIYSKEAYRKMQTVLNDFEPDVVHLNNINFQLTPSVIEAVRDWEKKNQKNVRIIFTAHDYQWVCPNHMMLVPASGERCSRCLSQHEGNCTRYRCIHNSFVKSMLGTIEAKFYDWKKTYAKVDVVICPSEFMEQQLATSPLLKSKLVTLHNFIDAQTPEPVEKKDYVLYFGRYTREKGVQTLLQAAKALPEIPFVFAGDGECREQVEQCGNVKNMGFLQGKVLSRVIREARFCVIPSEWYENCPFSVMEAISFGTPVLGSKLGGIPELVRDGETGELFEAGNVEALTEKIRSLWTDRRRCQQYAENCRKTCFDSVEEYTHKLLKWYQVV